MTSIAGETVILDGKNVLTAGYPFATIDSAWTGESFTRPAWREGMRLGLIVGGVASAIQVARYCSDGGCSAIGAPMFAIAIVAVGGGGGALIGSAVRARDTRWRLVHPVAR